MKEAQARTVYLKDYRPPDFLIEETHLAIDLYEEEALVESRLLMRRNPKAERPDAPLVLDGVGLELLEAAIDGRALGAGDYRVDAEQLVVQQVPDSFSFSCRTRIRPQDNTSLEGLYKSRVMFCTQCEAEGFRKITYYLDRPDVLSVFTTRVSAERGRYPVLLSNGNLQGSGACEDDASRHWATWHDPFPKPSYLFALVAGDLREIDDRFTTCSGREVSLRLFVEDKDLDKGGFALASLKRAMRWDEEVYGREYDLDVFMIVAVDDFNMGAMENKGLNIFNASCVLANPALTTDAAFQRIESIVAHEYFHNWSGNRVTCRDWFQLSLKEGFTVYRDSEFSADMASRAVKRVEDVKLLRTAQFAEDAGPMAHPVRPDSYMEISNFYTVTIYEKGAEVVRMIAELLGPEKFRAGCDLYFARFDGQAITTEDFVRCMEEAGGLDLGQFRRWYSQAGTPVLEVDGEHDAAAGLYRLRVRQHCPPTPGQPEKQPFLIPLRLGLLDPQGRELPLRLKGEASPGSGERVLQVSQAEETFEFTGIRDCPVPSLLRGFSAPVKLRFHYDRDQLMFLMSHDSDGFVRWEAGQQLALQIIDELLAARREGRELALDERLIRAFRAVLRGALREPGLDRAMLALLIQLPTEAYIAEQQDGAVDVEGIHAVREFLRRELAEGLADDFDAVYQALDHREAYAYEAGQVADRGLKNTVLDYLSLLDHPRCTELCLRQYREADNMSDVSAALRALVNSPAPAAREHRDTALADFYSRWRDESLAVEQWLAIQAGANRPDNLERVKALMDHEAFSLRNPNKVRAVIGSFCNHNPAGFHAAGGAGYRFLADQVLALDALNPQIAARLLTPLTRWRRYDEERQGLMREQLRRILGREGLSRDVYEVVSKSLGD